MSNSISTLLTRNLQEVFGDSLRRGIETQLAPITRDPMAAKGLLRHSSVNTTLTHYIKDVPEVTANGMAQVEQLFSNLDDEREVQ